LICKILSTESSSLSLMCSLMCIYCASTLCMLMTKTQNLTKWYDQINTKPYFDNFSLLRSFN